MKFSEIDYSPLPRFIELLKKAFGNDFMYTNTGGLDYDEIEIKFSNEKNIIRLRFFDPINTHEIVTPQYSIQTEFCSDMLDEYVKFLVKPELLDDDNFINCLKELLTLVPVIEYGLKEDEIDDAITKWFNIEIEKSKLTSFVEIVEKF